MTNEICDAENPWTSEFCERPMGHDGPHGLWHDGEDEEGRR